MASSLGERGIGGTFRVDIFFLFCIQTPKMGTFRLNQISQADDNAERGRSKRKRGNKMRELNATK
jgi:hypothetical protein